MTSDWAEIKVRRIGSLFNWLQVCSILCPPTWIDEKEGWITSAVKIDWRQAKQSGVKLKVRGISVSFLYSTGEGEFIDSVFIVFFGEIPPTLLPLHAFYVSDTL